MEIPAAITEGVTLLDRSRFSKVRDQWIRPSFDLTGLKFLRLKAESERFVRELYRNRAPYELLQNADDAKAKRAVFILTPEGMAFVHDGAWFTVANFRSLADGWSDKDPKQCIGHKGLGFRSVLDITPAPHVIQVGAPGFFGFKFSWALNNGHIQETFQKQPALREEYRQWTRHGQTACPVMAIPGEAKQASMGVGASVFDEVIRGVYGTGFSTMFWFPSCDPDANRQVIEDLGVCPLVSDATGRKRMVSFIEKEVAVLIPFLSCLEDISLHIDKKAIAKSTATGNRKSEVGSEVHVQVTVGEQCHDASFFQMHTSASIPPNIKNDPQTPRAYCRSFSTFSRRRSPEREPHFPALWLLVKRTPVRNDG